MNIFVIGRKYQGKTTLAVYLARTIQKRMNGYKILVFEPKWTLKSIPHSDNLVEFSDMLDDPKHSEVMLYAGSSVSDDATKDADAKAVREDFTGFYFETGMEDFLRDPPERPVVVVIDEAYYLQGDGYVHPLLARMMRLASEGKLYIIMAVHRPVDLAPDVRNKADELFFFNEFEPNDLKLIREMCGEEVSQIVSRLPDHHVLKYVVNGRRHETWDHPKGWYSDISKEPKLERSGNVELTSAI